MGHAQSSSMQTSAKKAVADAREGDLEGFKENLGMVARQAGKVVEKKWGKARRTATEAAGEVEKTARAHPYAAVGVTFGAGALLGAILHAVLRPVPTALEIVVRALKNSAVTTRDSFVSGLRTVRRAAR